MDNIKDVDFEDVNNETSEERIIRGSALYYNTSQVASILNIPDSTVRYYSKIFDNLLDIEVINKQRKYKQSDIDKLKFIVELKDEGMSLKQIEQYCSQTSFEDGSIQVKESNPLSIQALAKAIMDHQETQIMAMEDRIIKRLEENVQSQIAMNERALESIREEVATTVDEVISEKLSDFNEANIEEFKRVNEKLDRIAYVSSEEISKQKKDAPNKWWRWFKGEK